MLVLEEVGLYIAPTATFWQVRHSVFLFARTMALFGKFVLLVALYRFQDVRLTDF